MYIYIWRERYIYKCTCTYARNAIYIMYANILLYTLTYVDRRRRRRHGYYNYDYLVYIMPID